MDRFRRRFLTGISALTVTGSLAGCTGNVSRDVSGTADNAVSDLTVDSLDSWASGRDGTYRAALVIHGSLRNTSESAIAFPRIRAAFYAPSGDEIGSARPAYLVVDGKRRDVADAPAEIPAGESVEFRFIYEPEETVSEFVVNVE